MEIVAFDTDDKADGSGKAKITWLSKDLLPTTHKMNSTATTAGGWEASEMRTYLKNTIKPLIPETVRNAIVPVTKVQAIYNGALVKDGQITTDDVWIPSNHEVCAGDAYESTGAIYNSKFTSNNTSRIKKGLANNVYDVASWWTRTATTANYYRYIKYNGQSVGLNANNGYGVVLGFCT